MADGRVERENFLKKALGSRKESAAQGTAQVRCLCLYLTGSRKIRNPALNLKVSTGKSVEEFNDNDSNSRGFQPIILK